jgi:hypothetical protein
MPGQYQRNIPAKVHNHAWKIEITTTDLKTGDIVATEKLMILDDTGNYLEVGQGRTLRGSFSPASLNTTFPTLNLTTGVAGAGTTTLNATLQTLNAYVRSLAVAADLAEANPPAA